jgi:predicted alpha/beta-hydrolase family hydrolase
MRAWAERLRTLGQVHPFDYPYMREGRKRPDPQKRLIEAHREALQAVRAESDGPVVLAGKSMGSRIGCHLALEEPVDALVCLGYPLVSPGKSGKVRDQVLLELRVPILFVQGTRDRLCPLEQIEEVRGRMRAPSAVHVVETGDHSLQVTKRYQREHGETQQDVDGRILAAVEQFLKGRRLVG